MNQRPEKIRSSFSSFIRGIALTLIVSFSMSELAHAAPAFEAPLWRGFAANPHRITLPENIAKISDIHRGSNGRLLIHIQDAHLNLSAQQNIAKILKEVIERYKIKTIFVEGGTKDDSLNFLHPIAEKEIRERVAKKYLMQGELKGSEYLNLASDYDMRLLGVEDKELYEKNLKNYAQIAQKREAVLSYVIEIRKRVESLKRRLFPKIILEFDDFLKQFQNKEKDFTEYFSYLSRLSKQYQINLLGYPHFLFLKKLKEAEDQIDFKKAEGEQTQLFKKLSQNTQALENLSSHFNKLKAHDLNKLSLYEDVLTESKSLGIAVDEYPHLLAYVDYLRIYAKMDLSKLDLEMRRLEDQIFRASLSSDKAFYLHEIAEYLKITETLFSLKISKEDFDDFELKQKESRFNSFVFLAFLNQELFSLGNYAEAIEYSSIIDDNKNTVREFYKINSKRDEIFLEKAFSKMQDENILAAVLITGGYHTSNLTHLLKQQNTSYVVAAPFISEETNLQKYESMLLSQLGKDSPLAKNKKTKTQDAFDIFMALERGPIIQTIQADLQAEAALGSRLASEKPENLNSISKSFSASETLFRVRITRALRHIILLGVMILPWAMLGLAIARKWALLGMVTGLSLPASMILYFVSQFILKSFKLTSTDSTVFIRGILNPGELRMILREFEKASIIQKIHAFLPAGKADKERRELVVDESEVLDNYNLTADFIKLQYDEEIAGVMATVMKVFNGGSRGSRLSEVHQRPEIRDYRLQTKDIERELAAQTGPQIASTLRKWLNQLVASKFVLRPGMSFGSLVTWWNNRTRLDSHGERSHTGTDFALLVTSAGYPDRLNAKEEVPVFVDGQVQWIFEDDMQKTVVTRTPIEMPNGKEEELITVYMHLDLDVRLKAGEQVEAGDNLGHLSYSRNTKSVVRPHLHVTFGILRDHKILNTQNVNPSILNQWIENEQIVALDPKKILKDRYEELFQVESRGNLRIPRIIISVQDKTRKNYLNRVIRQYFPSVEIEFIENPDTEKLLEEKPGTIILIEDPKTGRLSAIGLETNLKNQDEDGILLHLSGIEVGRFSGARLSSEGGNLPLYHTDPRSYILKNGFFEDYESFDAEDKKKERWSEAMTLLKEKIGLAKANYASNPPKIEALTLLESRIHSAKWARFRFLAQEVEHVTQRGGQDKGLMIFYDDKENRQFVAKEIFEGFEPSFAAEFVFRELTNGSFSLQDLQKIFPENYSSKPTLNVQIKNLFQKSAIAEDLWPALQASLKIGRLYFERMEARRHFEAAALPESEKQDRLSEVQRVFDEDASKYGKQLTDAIQKLQAGPSRFAREQFLNRLKTKVAKGRPVDEIMIIQTFEELGYLGLFFRNSVMELREQLENPDWKEIFKLYYFLIVIRSMHTEISDEDAWVMEDAKLFTQEWKKFTELLKEAFDYEWQVLNEKLNSDWEKIKSGEGSGVSLAVGHIKNYKEFVETNLPEEPLDKDVNNFGIEKRVEARRLEEEFKVKFQEWIKKTKASIEMSLRIASNFNPRLIILKSNETIDDFAPLREAKTKHHSLDTALKDSSLMDLVDPNEIRSLQSELAGLSEKYITIRASLNRQISKSVKGSRLSKQKIEEPAQTKRTWNGVILTWVNTFIMLYALLNWTTGWNPTKPLEKVTVQNHSKDPPTAIVTIGEIFRLPTESEPFTLSDKDSKKSYLLWIGNPSAKRIRDAANEKKQAWKSLYFAKPDEPNKKIEFLTLAYSNPIRVGAAYLRYREFSNTSEKPVPGFELVTKDKDDKVLDANFIFMLDGKLHVDQIFLDGVKLEEAKIQSYRYEDIDQAIDKSKGSRLSKKQKNTDSEYEWIKNSIRDYFSLYKWHLITALLVSAVSLTGIYFLDNYRRSEFRRRALAAIEIIQKEQSKPADTRNLQKIRATAEKPVESLSLSGKHKLKLWVSSDEPYLDLAKGIQTLQNKNPGAYLYASVEDLEGNVVVEPKVLFALANEIGSKEVTDVYFNPGIMTIYKSNGSRTEINSFNLIADGPDGNKNYIFLYLSDGNPNDALRIVAIEEISNGKRLKKPIDRVFILRKLNEPGKPEFDRSARLMPNIKDKQIADSVQRIESLGAKRSTLDARIDGARFSQAWVSNEEQIKIREAIVGHLEKIGTIIDWHEFDYSMRQFIQLGGDGPYYWTRVIDGENVDHSHALRRKAARFTRQVLDQFIHGPGFISNGDNPNSLDHDQLKRVNQEFLSRAKGFGARLSTLADSPGIQDLILPVNLLDLGVELKDNELIQRNSLRKLRELLPILRKMGIKKIYMYGLAATSNLSKRVHQVPTTGRYFINEKKATVVVENYPTRLEKLGEIVLRDSWGNIFSINDMKKINPEFSDGDAEKDLLELTEDAKDMGITVITDFISWLSPGAIGETNYRQTFYSELTDSQNEAFRALPESEKETWIEKNILSQNTHGSFVVRLTENGEERLILVKHLAFFGSHSSDQTILNPFHPGTKKYYIEALKTLIDRGIDEVRVDLGHLLLKKHIRYYFDELKSQGVDLEAWVEKNGLDIQEGETFEEWWRRQPEPWHEIIDEASFYALEKNRTFRFNMETYDPNDQNELFILGVDGAYQSGLFDAYYKISKEGKSARLLEEAVRASLYTRPRSLTYLTNFDQISLEAMQGPTQAAAMLLIILGHLGVPVMVDLRDFIGHRGQVAKIVGGNADGNDPHTHPFLAMNELIARQDFEGLKKITENAPWRFLIEDFLSQVPSKEERYIQILNNSNRDRYLSLGWKTETRDWVVVLLDLRSTWSKKELVRVELPSENEDTGFKSEEFQAVDWSGKEYPFGVWELNQKPSPKVVNISFGPEEANAAYKFITLKRLVPEKERKPLKKISLEEIFRQNYIKGRINELTEILSKKSHKSILGEALLFALLDDDYFVRAYAANAIANRFGSLKVRINPEVLLSHLEEPLQSLDSLEEKRIPGRLDFDKKHASRNKRYALLWALARLIYREGREEKDPQLAKYRQEVQKAIHTRLKSQAKNWSKENEEALRQLLAESGPEFIVGDFEKMSLLEILRLVQLRADVLKNTHDRFYWVDLALQRIYPNLDQILETRNQGLEIRDQKDGTRLASQDSKESKLSRKFLSYLPTILGSLLVALYATFLINPDYPMNLDEKVYLQSLDSEENLSWVKVIKDQHGQLWVLGPFSSKKMKVDFILKDSEKQPISAFAGDELEVYQPNKGQIDWNSQKTLPFEGIWIEGKRIAGPSSKLEISLKRNQATIQMEFLGKSDYIHAAAFNFKIKRSMKSSLFWVTVAAKAVSFLLTFSVVFALLRYFVTYRGKEEEKIKPETRDLLTYIQANWDQIIKSGAFAFDVDGTLMAKGKKISDPEYAGLLQVFKDLAQKGVLLVIITGNSLEDQRSRLIEPLKEAGILKHFIFYTNSASAKYTFDENGGEIIDQDYARKHAISRPDEIIQAFKEALNEAASLKFFSDEELRQAWQSWTKKNYPNIQFKMDWVNALVEFPALETEIFERMRKRGGELTLPYIEVTREGGFVVKINIRPIPKEPRDVRPQVVDILSRILKEKGLFSDLNLGVAGTSSIGVFSKNADKSEGIKNLIEMGREGNLIFYFGDDFGMLSKENHLPGNDESVADNVDLRNQNVRTVSVNPKEMIESKATHQIGHAPKDVELFLSEVSRTADYRLKTTDASVDGARLARRNQSPVFLIGGFKKLAHIAAVGIALGIPVGMAVYISQNPGILERISIVKHYNEEVRTANSFAAGLLNLPMGSPDKTSIRRLGMLIDRIGPLEKLNRQNLADLRDLMETVDILAGGYLGQFTAGFDVRPIFWAERPGQISSEGSWEAYRKLRDIYFYLYLKYFRPDLVRDGRILPPVLDIPIDYWNDFDPRLGEHPRLIGTLPQLEPSSGWPDKRDNDLFEPRSEPEQPTPIGRDLLAPRPDHDDHKDPSGARLVENRPQTTDDRPQSLISSLQSPVSGKWWIAGLGSVLAAVTIFIYRFENLRQYFAFSPNDPRNTLKQQLIEAEIEEKAALTMSSWEARLKKFGIPADLPDDYVGAWFRQNSLKMELAKLTVIHDLKVDPSEIKIAAFSTSPEAGGSYFYVELNDGQIIYFDFDVNLKTKAAIEHVAKTQNIDASGLDAKVLVEAYLNRSGSPDIRPKYIEVFPKDKNKEASSPSIKVDFQNYQIITEPQAVQPDGSRLSKADQELEEKAENLFTGNYSKGGILEFLGEVEFLLNDGKISQKTVLKLSQLLPTKLPEEFDQDSAFNEKYRRLRELISVQFVDIMRTTTTNKLDEAEIKLAKSVFDQLNISDPEARLRFGLKEIAHLLIDLSGFNQASDIPDEFAEALEDFVRGQLSQTLSIPSYKEILFTAYQKAMLSISGSRLANWVSVEDLDSVIPKAVEYIDQFLDLAELAKSEGIQYRDRTGNKKHELLVPKEKNSRALQVQLDDQVILDTDLGDFNAYESKHPTWVRVDASGKVTGVAIVLNKDEALSLQILRKDATGSEFPATLGKMIVDSKGIPYDVNNLILDAEILPIASIQSGSRLAISPGSEEITFQTSFKKEDGLYDLIFFKDGTVNIRYKKVKVYQNEEEKADYEKYFESYDAVFQKEGKATLITIVPMQFVTQAPAQQNSIQYQSGAPRTYRFSNGELTEEWSIKEHTSTIPAAYENFDWTKVVSMDLAEFLYKLQKDPNQSKTISPEVFKFLDSIHAINFAIMKKIFNSEKNVQASSEEDYFENRLKFLDEIIWFLLSPRGKQMLLHPSFLLMFLGVKPAYFHSSPEEMMPVEFFGRFNATFLRDLGFIFFGSVFPVAFSAPESARLLSNQKEEFKKAGFEVNNEALIQKLANTSYSQWSDQDYEDFSKLLQALFMQAGDSDQKLDFFMGAFSGYPIEDVKEYVRIGGRYLNPEEVLNRMTGIDTEFKKIFVISKSGSDEGAKLIESYRAVLYKAYARLNHHSDFPRIARSIYLPAGVFPDTKTEPTAAHRLEELNQYLASLNKARLNKITQRQRQQLVQLDPKKIGFAAGAASILKGTGLKEQEFNSILSHLKRTALTTSSKPRVVLPPDEIIEHYGDFDEEGINHSTPSPVILSYVAMHEGLRDRLADKIASLGSHLDIISIGSGRGELEAELIEKGHQVTGIELSPLNVQFSREKGVPTIEADVHTIQNLDHLYDVVLISEAIGHMDIDQVLTLAQKGLKRGGQIVLSTYDEAGSSPFSSTKYSIDSKSLIMAKLRSAGFKIQEVIGIRPSDGGSALNLFIAQKSGSRLASNFPIIVIADKLDDKKLNLDQVENVSALSSDDKVRRIVELNPQILLVRSETKVTKEIIDQLTNLKYIVRLGHGLDNVDVAYAQSKGIQVIGTKGSKDSVRALAMRFVAAAEQAHLGVSSTADEVPNEKFLSISSFEKALASKISKKSDSEKAELEAAAKKVFPLIGHETLESLKGKTIGIIGAGDIGEEIARTAKILGLNVLLNSRTLESNAEAQASARAKGFEPVSKEKIYDQAHYVVLITGLTQETKGMIGREAVGHLLANSNLIALINPDREGLVLESEIERLIQDGQIQYFVDEVPASAVLKERAFYVPHIGASTPEAEVSVLANTKQVLERVLQEISAGSRLALQKDGPRRFVSLNNEQARFTVSKEVQDQDGNTLTKVEVEIGGKTYTAEDNTTFRATPEEIMKDIQAKFEGRKLPFTAGNVEPFIIPILKKFKYSGSRLAKAHKLEFDQKYNIEAQKEVKVELNGRLNITIGSIAFTVARSTKPESKYLTIKASVIAKEKMESPYTIQDWIRLSYDPNSITPTTNPVLKIENLNPSEKIYFIMRAPEEDEDITKADEHGSRLASLVTTDGELESIEESQIDTPEGVIDVRSLYLSNGNVLRLHYDRREKNKEGGVVRAVYFSKDNPNLVLAGLDLVKKVEIKGSGDDLRVYIFDAYKRRITLNQSGISSIENPDGRVELFENSEHINRYSKTLDRDGKVVRAISYREDGAVIGASGFAIEYSDSGVYDVAQDVFGAYLMNVESNRQTLIAVTGEEASGKGSIAKRVQELLQKLLEESGKNSNVEIISVDSWLLDRYEGRRPTDIYLDKFELLGPSGLYQAIQDADQGNTIYVPIFDSNKRRREKVLDTKLKEIQNSGKPSESFGGRNLIAIRNLDASLANQIAADLNERYGNSIHRDNLYVDANTGDIIRSVVTKGNIVLFEGVMLLQNPLLSNFYSKVVYVETDQDERLLHALYRHRVSKRHADLSEEQVVDEFYDRSTLEGFPYTKPYMTKADYVITNQIPVSIEFREFLLKLFDTTSDARVIKAFIRNLYYVPDYPAVKLLGRIIRETENEEIRLLAKQVLNKRIHPWESKNFWWDYLDNTKMMNFGRSVGPRRDGRGTQQQIILMEGFRKTTYLNIEYAEDDSTIEKISLQYTSEDPEPRQKTLFERKPDSRIQYPIFGISLRASREIIRPIEVTLIANDFAIPDIEDFLDDRLEGEVPQVKWKIVPLSTAVLSLDKEELQDVINIGSSHIILQKGPDRSGSRLVAQEIVTNLAALVAVPFDGIERDYPIFVKEDQETRLGLVGLIGNVIDRTIGTKIAFADQISPFVTRESFRDHALSTPISAAQLNTTRQSLSASKEDRSLDASIAVQSALFATKDLNLLQNLPFWGSVGKWIQLHKAFSEELTNAQAGSVVSFALPLETISNSVDFRQTLKMLNQLAASRKIKIVILPTYSGTADAKLLKYIQESQRNYSDEILQILPVEIKPGQTIIGSILDSIKKQNISQDLMAKLVVGFDMKAVGADLSALGLNAVSAEVKTKIDLLGVESSSEASHAFSIAQFVMTAVAVMTSSQFIKLEKQTDASGLVYYVIRPVSVDAALRDLLVSKQAETSA